MLQAMAGRLEAVLDTRACVRIVAAALSPPRIRIVSATPPRPVPGQRSPAARTTEPICQGNNRVSAAATPVFSRANTAAVASYQPNRRIAGPKLASPRFQRPVAASSVASAAMQLDIRNRPRASPRPRPTQTARATAIRPGNRSRDSRPARNACPASDFRSKRIRKS